MLGFSNRWYPDIIRAPVPHPLGSHTIRIPQAPLYVASKWEALRSRGYQDLLASHDFEDIVTVVAGRPELPGEVRLADEQVRSYLEEQATSLLNHPDFPTALAGALPEAGEIPGLLSAVSDRFRSLARETPGS